MYYDEAEEYYYGYDIGSDKGYDNLIKRLVLMARNCPEYKTWSKDRKLLADDKLEYNCPICGVEYEIAPIETHHFPKTLYEIVDYHVQRYIQSGTLDKYHVTPLQLVKEVMDLHDQNKVDYINLCKHCHEKFHSMDQKIRDAVFKLHKENKEKESIGEESTGSKE